MDSTRHATVARKSLAQVLYEASPSVGWTGPWENLNSDQTAWWEAYADLARRHIAEEHPEQREPVRPARFRDFALTHERERIRL